MCPVHHFRAPTPFKSGTPMETGNSTAAPRSHQGWVQLATEPKAPGALVLEKACHENHSRAPEMLHPYFSILGHSLKWRPHPQCHNSIMVRISQGSEGHWAYTSSDSRAAIKVQKNHERTPTLLHPNLSNLEHLWWQGTWYTAQTYLCQGYGFDSQKAHRPRETEAGKCMSSVSLQGTNIAALTPFKSKTPMETGSSTVSHQGYVRVQLASEPSAPGILPLEKTCQEDHRRTST